MVSNAPVHRILCAVVMLLLWNASTGLAQVPITVPIFEPPVSVLTNDSYSGRTSVIALTSPRYVYELALILDGFGVDKMYQYCWAEVRDTSTGKDLAWRAPCNPVKASICSLVFSPYGDFRVEVGIADAMAVEFQSFTSGMNVDDVQLTDEGDLILVTANGTPVWHSKDHIQKQQECREAFQPPNGSHRTRLAWFSVACSIALTLMAQIFSG